MDKKLAGLLGVVAGLTTLSSAQAAPDPSEALQASSYADLLAPIPSAAALLIADDALRAQEPAGEAVSEVQVAQGYYYPNYYQNHHHHHHHSYWGYYHHHHHHHHHQRTVIGIPGFGGVVVGR